MDILDRLPVSIDSENLCRDSGGRGGNGGPVSLSDGISSSLSMAVSIWSFDGRRLAIRFVGERLHRMAFGKFSGGLWSLRRMCWQLRLLRIGENVVKCTFNTRHAALTYRFAGDYDVGFDDDAHGLCIDCDTVISSFAVDLGVLVHSAPHPNRFDRPDDECRYSVGFGFDFRRHLRFHWAECVCFGDDCVVVVHANYLRGTSDDGNDSHLDLNSIIWDSIPWRSNRIHWMTYLEVDRSRSVNLLIDWNSMWTDAVPFLCVLYRQSMAYPIHSAHPPVPFFCDHLGIYFVLPALLEYPRIPA